MKVSSIKLNFLTLFLIIFPLVTSLGLYGYGLDFINSYYNNYISWELDNAVGWNIAATKVGFVALGPFLVAFFLSWSIYLLIKEHLSSERNLNKSIVKINRTYPNKSG